MPIDGYIQTMEYYSAIKGNKVLIYTTTWMDGLENITLSEKKPQTLKIKYYMIPFN